MNPPCYDVAVPVRAPTAEWNYASYSNEIKCPQNIQHRILRAAYPKLFFFLKEQT